MLLDIESQRFCLSISIPYKIPIIRGLTLPRANISNFTASAYEYLNPFGINGHNGIFYYYLSKYIKYASLRFGNQMIHLI